MAVVVFYSKCTLLFLYKLSLFFGQDSFDLRTARFFPGSLLSNGNGNRHTRRQDGVLRNVN